MLLLTPPSTKRSVSPTWKLKIVHLSGTFHALTLVSVRLVSGIRRIQSTASHPTNYLHPTAQSASHLPHGTSNYIFFSLFFKTTDIFECISQILYACNLTKKTHKHLVEGYEAESIIPQSQRNWLQTSVTISEFYVGHEEPDANIVWRCELALSCSGQGPMAESCTHPRVPLKNS